MWSSISLISEIGSLKKTGRGPPSSGKRGQIVIFSKSKQKTDAKLQLVNFQTFLKEGGNTKYHNKSKFMDAKKDLLEGVHLFYSWGVGRIHERLPAEKYMFV